MSYLEFVSAINHVEDSRLAEVSNILCKSIVREGMRTPWGKADYVEFLLCGYEKDFGIVSTSSHGGIKVSRRFNKLIPNEFRNSSGWYEEDIECAIPLYFCLSHEERKLSYREGESNESLEKCLKNWFYKQWESAFNVSLPLTESFKKAEDYWYTENYYNFISVSALNAEDKVKVWFFQQSTKKEVCVYLTHELYNSRDNSPAHKLSFTEEELSKFEKVV